MYYVPATLAQVETPAELEDYLRSNWSWQIQQKLKHSNYPENKKPSEIYLLLFSTMPFSAKTNALLKQADNNYKYALKDYDVTLIQGSDNWTTRVNNVVDKKHAIRIAVGRLVKFNPTKNLSIPLVQYRINSGEIDVSVQLA